MTYASLTTLLLVAPIALLYVYAMRRLGAHEFVVMLTGGALGFSLSTIALPLVTAVLGG